MAKKKKPEVAETVIPPVVKDKGVKATTFLANWELTDKGWIPKKK